MKKKATPRKPVLKSQKGFATLETLPLLVVFMVLTAFSLGSFGIIHTGILNSIGARTYAFETFRHRTNLSRFRETTSEHYLRFKNRVHVTISEQNLGNGNPMFPATERPIAKGLVTEIIRDTTTHNTRVHEQIQSGARNNIVKASPVWVMIQYGICLNVDCGDGG